MDEWREQPLDFEKKERTPEQRRRAARRYRNLTAASLLVFYLLWWAVFGNAVWAGIALLVAMVLLFLLVLLPSLASLVGNKPADAEAIWGVALTYSLIGTGTVGGIFLLVFVVDRFYF